MSEKPDLTFFCELPDDALERLFDDASLIKKLRGLNANISMGLLDFSSRRAHLVHRLTKSGIPVTAWLLLPKDRGYWTSLDTVSETARVYGEFKRWTEEHKLQWAAIGLDIEPRLDRMGLFSGHWKEQLPDLLKRMFQNRRYRQALNDLRSLFNIMRMDGFAVETYNFPFVIEERRASSDVLSRLMGTPPLDADREVLMLYSSFFEHDGDAMLWSYARQAEGIGLGSTGGGVELEGGEPLRSMRWIDLRRDLLIASQFSRHLYIFSLEGCVENGYIDHITDLDWQKTVHPPLEKARQIDAIRRLGTGLLWALSHPVEIILSGLILSRLFTPRRRG